MVSFLFSHPFCAASGQGDRNCLMQKRTHDGLWLSGLVPASDFRRVPLSAQAFLYLSKISALGLAGLAGTMVPDTENTLVSD